MAKITKHELRKDPIHKALENILAFILRPRIPKKTLQIGGAIVIVIALVLTYKVVNKPRRSPDAELRLLQVVVSLAQNDTSSVPQLLNELITRYRATESGKRAYFYYGVYELRRNNKEIAEEYFKKFFFFFIKDDLLKALAYGNLGNIYLDRGEYDKAISFFQKAEKTSPEKSLMAFYYFKRAKAYQIKGDFQESYTLLTEFSEKYKNSSLRGKVEEEIKFLKGYLKGVNLTS